MSLENVQIKFAAIIIPLAEKPRILSQFAMWLDLLLAEYKINGVISPECSGAALDPVWLRGHKRKVKGQKPRHVTPDKHRQTTERHLEVNESVTGKVQVSSSLESRTGLATKVSTNRSNLQEPTNSASEPTNSFSEPTNSASEPTNSVSGPATTESLTNSSTQSPVTKARNLFTRPQNAATVTAHFVGKPKTSATKSEPSVTKLIWPLVRIAPKDSNNKSTTTVLITKSAEEALRKKSNTGSVEIPQLNLVANSSPNVDGKDGSRLKSFKPISPRLYEINSKKRPAAETIHPPSLSEIYTCSTETGYDHTVAKFLKIVDVKTVKPDSATGDESAVDIGAETRRVEDNVKQFVIKTEPPEEEDQTCVTPAIKTVTQPGSPAESSDRPDTSTLQYVIKTEPPEFVDHSPIRHGANSTKPFLA